MKRGQIPHRPEWAWWYLDEETVVVHVGHHGELWLVDPARLPLIIGSRYLECEDNA